MSTRLLRTLAVAAVALAAPLALTHTVAWAQEEGEVDVGTFYAALEPHGRWFEHPQYGTVWAPQVDRDWRPYTRGRWVYTEEGGWLWEADEPWGWAVFHYGRWFLDDDTGWVWVPGHEWAPAWVAWRQSDEQVGWAPLPPEAEWRGDGLSFSETYYDSPRFQAAWCFAPVAALGAYSVYRYIYPPARNHLYVRQTRFVPSHSGRTGRIFVSGFDRRHYERVTGRRIEPVRIVGVSAPPRPGQRGGGAINVYRPRVTPTSSTAVPPRIGEQPRRGWGYGRPGVPAPAGVRPPNPSGEIRPGLPEGKPSIFGRRDRPSYPGEVRGLPEAKPPVVPRSTPAVTPPPPPSRPSFSGPPVRPHVQPPADGPRGAAAGRPAQQPAQGTPRQGERRDRPRDPNQPPPR